MINPCETKDQAEQPVLMVRTRTPVQQLPGVLGESYGKIMTQMLAMGSQPVGPPYVAYFNMDMNDLDMEIGFPVAQPLPGRDDVQPGNLPASKIATTLFTGPYGSLGEAYHELNEYIRVNDLQSTGTVYEFYLNDPAETPPDELVTQIVMPLK
jgi:effector-binding domain-containing protein